MIAYTNPWFRVVRKGDFYFVEEPRAENSAAVLPLKNGNVVLLEHRRPAQQDVTLEIPRGYAEAGETPAQCGARELTEETSLAVPPETLIELGRLRPNTAILASRVTIFLARIPYNQQVEVRTDEALSYLELPLADIDTWISAGRIEDAFTLSALALLRAAYRDKQP